MAVLMATPIAEESATVDEPVYLMGGYALWHCYGFTYNVEAPPLAKLISAAPLLGMDTHLSPTAQQILSRQVAFKHTASWTGKVLPFREAFPEGHGAWYYLQLMEGSGLGADFLYCTGTNNADKLLAPARWMQVALTVLTGVAILFWLRRLAGGAASALGVALWSLNPLALAYGHLVLLDMGETLMFVLAAWSFAVFLDRPSEGRAALCGLACGGALSMKFTGIVLAPILFVLASLHAITRKAWPRYWRHLPVLGIAAAGVVLALYVPYWSPAPPLTVDQATKIGVPAWFQILRPVLIPPDFFKGLAVQMMHEAAGHAGYLLGHWRTTGWWYYFPVALALKTPLPLLLLTAVGLLSWLTGLRRFSFQHAVPWVAALVYLLLAMAASINIGIRYVLPIFPLLAVGAASQFALRAWWMRRGAWLCAGWLLLVTCHAHPYFLEYFNEIARGPANGYRFLVDSNLDWGQDAKRLKQFLDQRGITNINLAYFGPGCAPEYYGVSDRRVTADTARQIHDGWLVISATWLTQPEWDWLRTNHQPVARVGYTLFVYRLTDAAASGS
jgi:4-amino-4-deoxy-L-arabinose transferase-like glycosyltransferase